MTYQLKVKDSWSSFEASFSFETWKSIFAIAGDYIFPKFYQDFKLSKNTQGEKGETYDFTLTYNTSALAGKKERKEFMEKYEICISEMKKNVFAAPFIVTCKALEQGKMDCVKFGIRERENVYIIPIGMLELIQKKPR